MAGLSRVLRSFTRSRRVIRTLESIDQGIREQNQYLARLADQFAPVPVAQPEGAEKLNPKEVDISFLNEEELGAALAYGAQMQQQTGRAPTDEELVVWLAERAEVAHTQSLNERRRR